MPEGFKELYFEFIERFDYELPTMELPAWETFEGLMEKARECLRTGVNTLKELYAVDYSDGNVYA